VNITPEENSARTTERAFGRVCAVTITLSAFLLFQIQPIISKTILPWFGGSPAVWTTCLLFFQIMLLAGYAWAHTLISRFRPATAIVIHALLLVTAVCLLPITPEDSWKPDPAQSPALRILLLLAVNLGLPYFLIASTAPLVQAWFSRHDPDRSAYRLYSLSNAASLAALLSYPFLVEPSMTTHTQCVVWSIGFGLFALSSVVLCAMVWRAAKNAPDGSQWAINAPREQRSASLQKSKPSLRMHLSWLLLPAIATMMLLAVTNHLCQQLVVIPFLWIAPLSVYLLTFIICFDSERWYVARWFALFAAMSVLIVANMMLSPSVDELYRDIGVGVQWTSWSSSIIVVGTMILLMQFLVSMVCHGELVRLRPAPEHLTSFYLMVAAGGALGGTFVAVVCPLIFSSYWEYKLGLLVCFLLALVIVYREGWLAWFGPLPILRWVTLLGGVVGLYLISSVDVGVQVGVPVESRRSFYGVHSIRHFPFDDAGRTGQAMYHGSTMHGYQYSAASRSDTPTLYYAENSGIGLALKAYPRTKPLRVGIIGLGAGTLATWGQPQDVFRFYEIDPTVVQLCRRHFTYLADSDATIEIAEGDARLVLEQEDPQAFDLLVIDAFSDDSVPTHLLSVEAFAVFQRHLNQDGVLAFHVSNRHLNLGFVVRTLAEHFQIPTRYVIDAPRVLAIEHPPSFWMLVTSNDTVLQDESIQEQSRPLPDGWRDLPLWTDKYSSLQSLLW